VRGIASACRPPLTPLVRAGPSLVSGRPYAPAPRVASAPWHPPWHPVGQSDILVRVGGRLAPQGLMAP